MPSSQPSSGCAEFRQQTSLSRRGFLRAGGLGLAGLSLADLLSIEAAGLLRPGSLVVADNVGPLFDPTEYLDYVRTCGHYDCEHRESTLEYSDQPDAVEISVYRP